MILDCPACHSRFLIPDAALGAEGRTVRCGRCRTQWFQSPKEGVISDVHYQASAAAIPAAEAAPAQAAKPNFATESTISFEEAMAQAAAAQKNDAPEEAPAADAGFVAGAFENAPTQDEVIDHIEERRQRAAARAEAAAKADDDIPYFEGPLDPATPYDERLLPALRNRLPASLWLKATALSMSAVAACLLTMVYAPAISDAAPWTLPVLRAVGAAPAQGLMLADVGFEARPEGENYKRFVIGCTVRNTGTTLRALPDLRLQIYNRAGERMVDDRKLLAKEFNVIAPNDEVPCDIPSPAMRPGTAQTIVLDLGSPADLWKRATLY